MKTWTPVLLLLAAVSLLPSWVVGFGALGVVAGWWVTRRAVAAWQQRKAKEAEFDRVWREAERRHKGARLYRVK